MKLFNLPYKILVHLYAMLLSYIPLKTKDKIVFDNFLGKGYGDNPKYICNEFIKRDLDYKLIWLVNDLSMDVPDKVIAIKYGSFRAIYEYATSKVWIDNVRNTFRPKKKPSQIYIQLWHGYFSDKPIEKQAESHLDKKYIKQAKYDGQIIDAITAGNKRQTEQYKMDFWLNRNASILEYGSPSYDPIYKALNNLDIKNKLRKKYHLDDSYYILYAPTFRDDYSLDAYNLNFQEIISYLNSKTNLNHKIIIRFHPNIASMIKGVTYSDNIINGNLISDYSELLIMCDAVISDYSSVLYDFAMCSKPAYIYAPDEFKYFSLRGSMDSYNNNPFTKSSTQTELLNTIVNFDQENYHSKIDAYFDKYTPFKNENASQDIVSWILAKL